jgi:hypothetical protein
MTPPANLQSLDGSAQTKTSSPLWKAAKYIVGGFFGLSGLYYWAFGRKGGGSDPKVVLNPAENLAAVEFTKDDAGKVTVDSNTPAYELKVASLKKEGSDLVTTEVPAYFTAEGKPLDARLNVFNTADLDTDVKLIAEYQKREEALKKSLPSS